MFAHQGVFEAVRDLLRFSAAELVAAHRTVFAPTDAGFGKHRNTGIEQAEKIGIGALEGNTKTVILDRIFGKRKTIGYFGKGFRKGILADGVFRIFGKPEVEEHIDFAGCFIYGGKIPAIYGICMGFAGFGVFGISKACRFERIQKVV